MWGMNIPISFLSAAIKYITIGYGALLHHAFLFEIIMKTILIILCITFISTYIFGQNPFVLSVEHKEIDAINDAIKHEDKYYFLRTGTFNFTPPFSADNYCDLIITSNKGEILETINLGEKNVYYHRILKIEGDDIYLVGRIKTDSCMSKLLISTFNIQKQELKDLSTYNLCENIVLKIKLVKGLNGKTFIDEYHSVGPYISKSIFEIDSNYQISLVKDTLNYSNAFSVDFSRKGYLINADRLKRFYDADFNFIKQKWFYEEVDCENEAQEPYGKNLLLIQTLQDRSDKPEFGFQLLLVDSMLNIKKKLVIEPGSSPGSILTPFYGGLEIRNENEIWVLYHAYKETEITQSFFVITKLDSNLLVQCQHFVGYDTRYLTYGLTLIEEGGVIVFGNRVPINFMSSQEKDIFAMVIGQDCQLPTTSLQNGAEVQVISVSAFPNPAINNLSFSISGFDPATLKVELINSAGQVLHSSADLSRSIEVPDLPAGQYFYRILQQEKILGVGSWVKQ